MRFRRLYFEAYGRFTDKPVEFGDGSTDLHVVLGLNEAGKSTMLEGLGDLLYGFPGRTAQDYIHQSRNLRVGADIETGKKSLSFVRKKGNKDTVLNPDGNVLPDHVLNPYINGDRSRFETTFGLSHESLREGGRHMLEAKDDAGQALFEASSGIANLGPELNRLEEEAETVYKPRGSKALLNKAISMYQVNTKEAKEALHTAKDWQVLSQKYESARETTKGIAEEQEDLTLKIKSLERIKRSRPKLARLNNLTEQLSELGDVTELPDDFAARSIDATTALTEAENEVKFAQNKHDRIEDDLKGINVDEQALAIEPEIEVLETLKSKTIAAETDLPVRISSLQAKIGEAQALMNLLGMSGSPKNISLADLPTIQQAGTLRRIASEHQVNASTYETKHTQTDELSRHIDKRKSTVVELPDAAGIENLKRIIDSIDGEGDLEFAYQTGMTAKERVEVRLEQLSVPLGLSFADMSKLLKRSAPTADQIDAHLADRTHIHDEIEKLQAEAEASERKAAVLQAKLTELESQVSVPSHQDLRQARQTRDEYLKTLLEAVGVESPLDLNAFSALKKDNETIDDLADRMIAGASEVATRDALTLALTEQREQANQCRTSIEHLNDKSAEWQAQWEAFWNGMEWSAPLADTAHDWLKTNIEAIDLLGRIAEDDRQMTRIQSDVQHHKSRLIAGMKALGTKTSREHRKDLVKEARDLHQRLENELTTAREREERLNEDIENHTALESEVERLREESAAIEKRWSKAIADGLGDISISIADDIENVLGPIEELRAALSDMVNLTHRIEAMQVDKMALEEKMITLSANKDDMTAIQACDALIKRCQAAVRDKEQKDTLVEKSREALEELESAKNTQATAVAVLDDLCHEASVADLKELPSVRNRLEKAKEIERDIGTTENDLLDEGKSLKESRDECDAEPMDGIDLRIEKFTSALNNVRNRYEETVREEQDLMRETEAIASADGAIGPEQRVQESLAEIQEDTERYVRIKAAAMLLRWAIEKHRRDNQAPLLAEASSIFSTLTLKAYEGLDIDIDNKDRIKIVGIREGRDINVEFMSDGTLDQLYLAIRLAAIKIMAEKTPDTIMPFIADDLLVNFDDDRAKATLSVLKELSSTTQVILFTHHRHLVKITEEAIGKTGFSLHKI